MKQGELNGPSRNWGAEKESVREAGKSIKTSKRGCGGLGMGLSQRKQNKIEGKKIRQNDQTGEAVPRFRSKWLRYCSKFSEGPSRKRKKTPTRKKKAQRGRVKEINNGPREVKKWGLQDP